MATESLLTTISNNLADAVAKSAAFTLQVHGGRRPGSGIVYAPDTVLTTARALGREDALHVRRPDGNTLDAQLAGWDPTTGLAVLHAPNLGLAPAVRSDAAARVGQIGIAIARSWSNALTASAGTIAVIGGPLPTGRRRAIEEIIRTTAPMHEGFSGGAFLDTDGAVIGVATAARIRGLGVIIPARIAWATAATVLSTGGVKRGYLGIAAQPARIADGQRTAANRANALLVVGVTDDSPAARGGILVGDLLVDVDGHAVESPEELFDLLAGDRIGRAIVIKAIRGNAAVELTVTVGERPSR